MRDRWLIVAVVATLVAVAGAAAHADPRPQRFELEANVPGLTASASMVGSSLTVTVQGARRGAHLDGAVALLACARSFVEHPAGGTTVDGAGDAHWTSAGLLTRSVRDGRHVLAVWSGARMVACAAIPSAAQRPASRPWGVWSFTRRFVD